MPSELADRLRERAARHHRSIQGEFMAILEQNLLTQPTRSPDEVLRHARKSGVKTASESVAMIRSDRRAH